MCFPIEQPNWYVAIFDYKIFTVPSINGNELFRISSQRFRVDKAQRDL